MPQTSHPNAAWVNTVSTSTPAYQHPARRTIGGEMRFRKSRLVVEVMSEAAGFCR